jgi:Zn-dependent M28 family amino/carboxypeptidase
MNRAHPSMALADPKLDDTAGEKFSLFFNPAKADALFEGSGHTFQEIADLGKDRKPMPHFELPASIKATMKMDVKEVTSSNIVAKLPGADPKMKDTYVVLSAHVDHVGIGQPINGDKIYNGAMDNASGTAVLMDVAAELKKSKEKLKRSLLFVFVTGEEKGLLGSQYFAAYPTVDAKAMVADINVDMFLPIVPLKVLTVYGLAESDLGDDARAAAEKEGVRVQPDPQPLRNVFIRSDQYNFIKKGIPALAMDVSFDPGSPEQDIFKKWRIDRYHAPSDDLQQPVDLQAAAKYEEIVRNLMVETANDDHRPEWKSDSFFRRYAGGQ